MNSKIEKLKPFLLAAVFTALVTGCDSRSEVLGETAAETTEAVENVEVAEASTVPEPAPEPAPPACQDCGRVVSITPVNVQGAGSGVGAVAGAVVGGLLGNQVGGGSGKKVATVVGAVGGAFAGNEVEKRTKQQTYYDVLVQLDVGGTRTVSVNDAQYLSPGTPVRVSGNNLELL